MKNNIVQVGSWKVDAVTKCGDSEGHVIDALLLRIPVHRTMEPSRLLSCTLQIVGHERDSSRGAT